MKLIPGNAQHIGGRQQQQDAFGVSALDDDAFRSHGGVLAVVADGMGGMAYGDAAAKAAVKTFLSAYAAKTPRESITDALLRCAIVSNTAVFDTATKLGTAGDTGTTLIAAVIHEQQMYWISAGDSAIFLWRDGEFTLVNDTHVYAHELDARVWMGQISHQLAQSHPEREALTSFLGLQQIPMVDRSRRGFHLQPGDAVLLASDGLFKTLSQTEMAASMHLEPQAMAEALVSRAIDAKREYQDNVTVVVLQVESGKPVTALPIMQEQRVPLVAAAPEIAERVAVESTPPAPARRSRLGLLLTLTALAVALGYAIFLFSYDPSAASNRLPPQAPERSADSPFQTEKAPPLERQPSQQPPPAVEPQPAPPPPP